MVDITSLLRSADERPGLNPYPSSAALLLHLLLHAAGNMQTHCLRQIQLHDIAALASRLRGADWGVVLAAPVPAEGLWWAFPPLALAARYYPGAVPTEVLRELRGACPRVLRLATDRAALTDVSWSNLHVHALPGIAWSRTPLDALRYVRSRALPSRSSLEGVQFALQVQPHLNQVPWYGTVARHAHRSLVVFAPAARADDGLDQRCAQKPRPWRGCLTPVVSRRARSTPRRRRRSAASGARAYRPVARHARASAFAPPYHHCGYFQLNGRLLPTAASARQRPPRAAISAARANALRLRSCSSSLRWGPVTWRASLHKE